MLEDGFYKEMLKNPLNFKYTMYQLPGSVIRSESIEKVLDSIKVVINTTAIQPDKTTEVTKKVPKRRYWKAPFNTNIQFTKNKSSKNWGNIDNMTLFLQNILQYNYERGKITSTNQVRTTHTIGNTTNDTIHKYVFQTDELYIDNRFSVKAIGNWNYSASAWFKSRMFNAYNANSDIRTAGFLAPFTLNLGLGMTYSKSLPFKKTDRAFTIAATISPLSFNYVCSTDDDIPIGKYPDAKLKHVERTFGSSVDIKNVIKYKKITLDTHINYFTNFELIRCPIDTKLSIPLNRYFSTNLQVWFNYDDSRQLAESEKRLQMKEVFTFGFVYNL
jgi:hypothetical protein